MNGNSVLTVLIENASCMEALGSVVGPHLLNPRLYPQQERMVVCAYGVRDCGKSPLLNASNKAICKTIEKSIPLEADGLNIYKAEDGLNVYEKDFGNQTYPDDRGEEVLSHSKYPIEIKKQGDRPSLYLFEHPPIDILDQADIGIVISWPGHPEKVDFGPKKSLNHFYLSVMSYEIDDCSKRAGATTSATSKVVEQMLAAKEDVCEDPTRRIVRIFSTKDNPEIEEALAKTKEAIRKTPNLHLLDLAR